MLILARKQGETLLIGDNIQVTVMAIDGMQVKLGIEAPVEVLVLRQELLRRRAQRALVRPE